MALYINQQLLRQYSYLTPAAVEGCVAILLLLPPGCVGDREALLLRTCLWRDLCALATLLGWVSGCGGEVQSTQQFRMLFLILKLPFVWGVFFFERWGKLGCFCPPFRAVGNNCMLALLIQSCFVPSHTLFPLLLRGMLSTTVRASAYTCEVLSWQFLCAEKGTCLGSGELEVAKNPVEQEEQSVLGPKSHWGKISTRGSTDAHL